MDDPSLPREGLQLTPGSSPLALRLAVMAIVLIVVVSAMESRRMLRESLAAKSGQPAASGKAFWNLPAPRAVSGDYLIAVDARQREAVRKSLIACGLYPLVLAALTVAMVLGSGSAGAATEHEIRALLLYAYGPAVALAALASAIDGRRRWRSLGQRIGTDGSALLYDAGDGVVSRHEWDTVLANRRSLLIGSKMVSLYGGLRSDPTPVFPFDELREVVLARLPRTAFAEDLSFWWTALRRGCAVALWQSAVIVVLLATCFMPPERSSALRDMYRAFLRSRMH